jgi:hypothetical protein
MNEPNSGKFKSYILTRINVRSEVTNNNNTSILYNEGNVDGRNYEQAQKYFREC